MVHHRWCGRRYKAGRGGSISIHEILPPVRSGTFEHDGNRDSGTRARAALQAAIHAVEPGQPVARFASLDAALGDRLASRRFTTFLLSLFAATALVITGVGLYGLLSYLVT